MTKNLGILGIVLALALTGCSANLAQAKTKIQVVASTSIIADLAKQVAGSDAEVVSLVPAGADPHTTEPTLAAIKQISLADLAFSNQLLLEPQSLLNAIDANLPKGAKHIGLAEESRSHGAQVIPLVEDAALNTLWLGMRVAEGTGDSQDSVEISATAVSGPGQLSAYIVGAFGQPQIYFNSADGLDARDVMKLPTNAHTHVSWAFTKPGWYSLEIKAQLRKKTGETKDLGTAKIRFAVGVDAHGKAPNILDNGHIDITVKLSGQIGFYGDIHGDADKHRQDKTNKAAHNPANQGFINTADAIVSVPNVALTTVPADPSYRFIGNAGAEVYLLAQAVLGKHVHGEFDPHLWHDVQNTIAYVEVIKEALMAKDPKHAAGYSARATAYIEKLRKLDKYLAQVYGAIPESQRNLVTTHDGFGYLARAYNLNIAGFVAANPSMEPSTQDMIRLAKTLQALHVSAVFIEPKAASHQRELVTMARDHQIEVCNIYGDTLGPDVPTYIDFMVRNAQNIKVCLDRASWPAWSFAEQTKK